MLRAAIGSRATSRRSSPMHPHRHSRFFLWALSCPLLRWLRQAVVVLAQTKYPDHPVRSSLPCWRQRGHDRAFTGTEAQRLARPAVHHRQPCRRFRTDWRAGRRQITGRWLHVDGVARVFLTTNKSIFKTLPYDRRQISRRCHDWSISRWCWWSKTRRNTDCGQRCWRRRRRHRVASPTPSSGDGSPQHLAGTDV